MQWKICKNLVPYLHVNNEPVKKTQKTLAAFSGIEKQHLNTEGYIREQTLFY